MRRLSPTPLFALVLPLLLVAVCLALFAVPALGQTNQERLADSRFDHSFQRWSGRYLPAYDWRWLKAQCYQESRFDYLAVSPAGARGICQFMPGTWNEAERAIGVQNVWRPDENIRAGAWYMSRMLRFWVWDRTDQQRLELAQASYNAGAGNIHRAQIACHNPKLWPEIRVCLHLITGHHSAETIQYVDRIAFWYGLMERRP